MIAFGYDSELLARYPNVVGGVVVARGLRNGPASGELREAFATEQKAAIERIGSRSLSEIPSLAGWRKAFRAFGVDPTQYRSAAEALLRRLTKTGDIPSINTLVDIGNLVSIRHALPAAVFDVRLLRLPVTVRFSDGSERYTTLGETEVEHPVPGEVIFADGEGVVVARRWCWRQSEESAAGEETETAIITLEAHHDQAHSDVESALDDLQRLLGTYAGGSFTADVLGADKPWMEAEL